MHKYKIGDICFYKFEIDSSQPSCTGICEIVDTKKYNTKYEVEGAYDVKILSNIIGIAPKHETIWEDELNKINDSDLELALILYV